MQSAAAAAPSAAPHSTTTTTSVFFSKDSRPLPCLLLTSLLLLLTLHLSSSSSTTSTPTPSPPPPPPPPPHRRLPSASSAGPPPPTLAFLLTGSAGDADRLHRLLLATYHPRNVYLLLLDRAASAEDRARLARAARGGADAAGPGRDNVHVVGDPGFANPRGASKLAATLHGAAMLLRVHLGWDWFVHLHADEYPLVTPDDLLHVFSYLPKDLNFIQHTSYIGWKEERQIRPIIVDPGLYLSSRNDIFYATQKRDLPNAYKLFTAYWHAIVPRYSIIFLTLSFLAHGKLWVYDLKKALPYPNHTKTGSSSVILSRKFIEYCIVGMDNLPRTLLMYYTNMPLPHTKYFQTVLCNSPEFNKTVVNHDLHYSIWDARSKNEPHLLTIDDVENMTNSGAAFGTRFPKDDHVLDHIDAEILHRLPGEPVTGGWCIGVGHDSPCDISGNPDVLRPGPKAIKLAKFLAERLSYRNFYGQQCIWD